MDFGKAFSYPFEDSEWARKIGLPALILLIPIIGTLFVLGWTLDITRRVIRRDPTPLPEIDFAKQLSDGLKAFVIGLVYSIPIIVLTLPISIFSASLENSTAMNNEGALAAYTVLTLCCTGLSLLYGLFMAFLVPAAYTNFIVKDDLSAGLRFKEVFNLVRAAPGAYLLVVLGVLVSGFVAQFGLILCIIGVIFTYAYAMAVSGHLYGQAYLEASQNLGYSEQPYTGTSF